jgi:hypothetical protein
VSLYVIGAREGDGFLLLSIDGGVMAFETKHAAEDYADGLDEPGEFCAIPYADSMGPCVVII